MKHTPFKVASVEFNPELNNLDDNLIKLEIVVREASMNGAKLIVTPEMATTGYHYEDRRSIRSYVDTIPGKTTSIFEKVAAEYDTHIVIGMAEVDEEESLYYNSAALIGPKGYIGKYRKIHQWASEDAWSVWGDLGMPVFETEIGNLSMMICMDSCYFESARLAAVNGADILCFPTNSTGQSLSMLQAWAEMNGLYVIGANRSNTERGYHMTGASVVYSPDGEKLSESVYTEEGMPLGEDETVILYAEIDPSKFDNKGKARLRNREPQLYGDLMLYRGPWFETKQHLISDVSEVAYKHQASIQCALLQYEPVIGNKEANLRKVSMLIKQSVDRLNNEEKELSLVVCPALSLTGSVDSLDERSIRSLAETMDGYTIELMKKLAMNHNVTIVFGMIERESSLLYDTIVVLDFNGEIIDKARKLHLSPSEKRWASAGEDIFVTAVEGIGRIGLINGSDVVFPEVAGVMAVKNVDMILIPSSWYGEYGTDLTLHPKLMQNKFPVNSMTTWDATARFAQAYTLIANFVGTKQRYKGGSGIYTLDPIYGEQFPQIASSDKEEALRVDVPILKEDWWFNQQKLLLSRRTAYYKPLIQKIKRITANSSENKDAIKNKDRN